MLIKVCGICSNEDIAVLSDSGADFIGLIFHMESLRYAVGNIDPAACVSVTNSKLTGIFVDADTAAIMEIADEYSLKVIQLHGDETPECCRMLSAKYAVIKVFRISEQFEFKQCDAYDGICDYFLFDAAGKKKGGNGISWDWRRLDSYKGQTKFIVSGGITCDDVKKIEQIRHPLFAGVDINSGFEIRPGKKNTKTVKAFIQKIKTKSNVISSQHNRVLW